MDDKLKIFLIGLACIVTIFIYGILRCRFNRDYLQYKLKILDFDLWSVTHILFYFALTYIYPNEYVYIFILGILWEISEYILGGLNPKNIKYLMGECGYMKKDESWWYGKFSDILANSIGIMLALLLKKYNL